MARKSSLQNVILGKTILLTGAGGFIGSALAEAIVELKPSHWILLDHSEQNLNEIDVKLADMTTRGLYTSAIGDKSNMKLLSEICNVIVPTRCITRLLSSTFR